MSEADYQRAMDAVGIGELNGRVQDLAESLGLLARAARNSP